LVTDEQLEPSTVALFFSRPSAALFCNTGLDKIHLGRQSRPLTRATLLVIGNADANFQVFNPLLQLLRQLRPSEYR
jgi:hypothetical protein